ncbi:MAG: AzlD domain-containing protein [Clostridiales bacterium]|nr:AzlD domain-containing protein [Clostridiales bacterium]
MDFMEFLPYLVVMAGVTYLIRVIPLVLVKHKIKNQFLTSFLYYIPYTVLASMTFPAILYATGSMISAAAGLAVAVVLAFRRRSLIVVATGACVAVLVVEIILKIV